MDLTLFDALDGCDERVKTADQIGVRISSACAVLSPEPENGRVLIKKLVVDPVSRKTGEGSRLLTRIILAANKAGFSTALVAVPLDHPDPQDKPSWRAAVTNLNRFYDRHGFSDAPLRERACGLPITSWAAKAFAKEISAAAQTEIDAWSQDVDGVDELLGTGGACGLVASRIMDVLSDLDVSCVPGETDFEGGHEFVHALFLDGVFRVDIPASVYETGGGYVWTKRPDARIAPDHVLFERVSGPMTEPEFLRAFTDEGGADLSFRG